VHCRSWDYQHRAMVNRPMRYGIIVSLVVLIAAQATSALQDNPENAILRWAAAAVRKTEPEWLFISAILNAPALIDEELGVAAGGRFRSVDDQSTGVVVTVSRVSSTEAAVKWLYGQAHDVANNGSLQAMSWGTVQAWPRS
jgi:hypothetical protein